MCVICATSKVPKTATTLATRRPVKMMAAAQAAAEAAAKAATVKEQRSTLEGVEEAAMVNLLQDFDPFQVAMAAQDGSAAQSLLHEMMAGYQMNNSSGNMQSLLEMMVQKEQEKLRGMQMEEQLPARPTTHYLTIANDGKFARPVVVRENRSG